MAIRRREPTQWEIQGMIFEQIPSSPANVIKLQEFTNEVDVSKGDETATIELLRTLLIENDDAKIDNIVYDDLDLNYVLEILQNFIPISMLTLLTPTGS